MNSNEITQLNFYRTQSEMSDPGAYAFLLDAFPTNLKSMKEIISGLFLHFIDATKIDKKISLMRLSEIEIRYVEKILKRMMVLDDRFFLLERDLEKKLLTSCRDFSLFACSILRHNAYPARVRVAFNTFYLPDLRHDQLVLEYWDAQDSAWHFCDMRMTESYLNQTNISLDFDFFNLPKDKYLPAAHAWFDCRKYPDRANGYGGGKNRGLWYVRDRLLQDLAALNKVEMLIWDCWGLMEVPEEKISSADLLLLDKVAGLLLEPDEHFHEIRNLYCTDESLRVPEKIISFSPVLGKREVKIASHS